MNNWCCFALESLRIVSPVVICNKKKHNILQIAIVLFLVTFIDEKFAS